MTLIEIANYLEKSLPTVKNPEALERYSTIVKVLHNYIDIKTELDKMQNVTASQVPATLNTMERNYILGKNNAYHEIREMFKYEK